MPPAPGPVPTISVLLNLVPDRPATVLQSLEQHPVLASQQDQHGYSLLHAAASYGQLDLLRQLVRSHGASPDIADEDGETPLFYAESVDVARCLVEELGADPRVRNTERQTAAGKIELDDDFPEVVAYLRTRLGGAAAAREGEGESAAVNGQGDGVHPPPRLPPNVQINVGTMEEPLQDQSEPDPEFRRRIEELASREDFQGEEGQAQLRELITDAVRGVAADGDSRGGSRRRVE